MKNYIIIMSSLLLLGCSSTYVYRGDSNNRWVPDLQTTQNEQSIKSTDKSTLPKMEVQKTDERISSKNSISIIPSVSKDTFYQIVPKKTELLEKRLTDLTVNTAHIIPQKINRIISKKSETKIPGFLTYKCRSLGMTIGYRLFIYGLIAMIVGYLLMAFDVRFGPNGWVTGPGIVVVLSLLIAFLGLLIWFFSLIITSLTQ